MNLAVRRYRFGVFACDVIITLRVVGWVACHPPPCGWQAGHSGQIVWITLWKWENKWSDMVRKQFPIINSPWSWPFDPKINRADSWLMGSKCMKFHHHQWITYSVMVWEPFSNTIRSKINISQTVSDLSPEYDCLCPPPLSPPITHQIIHTGYKQLYNTDWYYYIIDWLYTII